MNYILSILLIVTIVNVVDSSTLHNVKDITYTIYQGVDQHKSRCTVVFKPRLLPQNYIDIDSNHTKQAFTSTCSHLTIENRQKHQLNNAIFTTKITSDQQIQNNKDSIPIICSIPRSVLNNTQLTYERLKLHLNAISLNLEGCSYHITQPPASIADTFDPSTNNIFVSIDIAHMAQKPAIEPPVSEQEKEAGEKSFLQKYWYYVLPLVIITVLNLVMGAGGGGEEGPAAGNGGGGGGGRRSNK
ncbi:hypothetical protein SAMD00019534_050590 [Acytostelium subglobosum LB1]|uniref:hypothetical protein n=1 Tax=Acytostelium subglobosum LB1 TaxID=1410327 RepID=UPI000644A0F7|nr:hypothetical protein SAMD00019534_050590 [Acytostelium subglobosum LB1]GAM21884.1 hypothetical protein SAMD00019534_050590 [Acytostelium subglobosum LB1]|eukprot:XP_012754984.1 hypothetical protein SAMD00019534_050590 [Acytostelium subglobosum LB1]